jgi:hypothetical protein
MTIIHYETFTGISLRIVSDHLRGPQVVIAARRPVPHSLGKNSGKLIRLVKRETNTTVLCASHDDSLRPVRTLRKGDGS